MRYAHPPTTPHRRVAARAAALLLGAVLLTLPAVSAQAHDFWIEAPVAPVAPETPCGLTLRVGDHFEGEAYGRNPRHIAWFRAEGQHGRVDLPGKVGLDPAGTLTWKQDDLVVVAYESHPTPVTLEAEKFESYLAEEGLDHVLATRKRLGRSKTPGRERFSRCAKTLVQIGKGAKTGFDRRTGLTLEIVPLTDPRRLQPGDALEVLVLYRGKPIQNIEINALCRPVEGKVAEAKATSPKLHSRSARTNAKGRVRFQVEHAGEWLLAGVHMEQDRPGSGAAWRSWWTSLTFRVDKR